MADLPQGALVDHERGLVSPTVFVDREIFNREMQQIFGRCWLYLAHESQLATPGSFTAARMGGEALLVCRSERDRISAFLNMCPSCSSLLSRADSGNAPDFTCVYHGWKFDLEGRVLVEDEQGKLVPSDDLTLIPVEQMDSYRGLLFATFDREAPPLDVFLGDIRWGLDLLLDQGDLRVASVTKWTVEANWKFAAEGSVNDIYHGLVHLSALHADNSEDAEARRERELSLERPGFTIITEFGHGLNAEYVDDALDPDDPMQQWRRDPVTQRRLGAFRMQVSRSCVTLFPNAMLAPAARELYLWHPRSVNETEVWLITFYNEGEPPEVRRAFQKYSQLHHGPAGIYSQDEAENWEGATKGSQGVVVASHPLNYQMGLGHGEIIEDEKSPPRIETLINEHRQLWFYRNWAHAMQAEDWQRWRETLPRPTGRM